MKADDNRKVTLCLHSRGQRLPAVLTPKVDFMHRVADKDGPGETRVGGAPAASAGATAPPPASACHGRPGFS